MDATSVMIGTQVRDDLAEYRDENELKNYNETIKALLSQANESEEIEVASA